MNPAASEKVLTAERRDELLESIKETGRALGRMTLYSIEHPSVQGAVAAAHGRIADYTRKYGDLTLGVLDGQFLVDGIPLKGALSDTFRAAFDRTHLESVSFHAGVEAAEVDVLYRLFAHKPDSASDYEWAKSFLSDRGVARISVNTTFYRRDADEAKAAVETPDADWTRQLGGLPIETLLFEIVKRAVPDPADRKRVFDLVMAKLKAEIEAKVEEATLEIRREKEVVEGDKARTEAVIAGVAGGEVIVDEQGKVLLMNPAAERIVGGSLKEKAGGPLSAGFPEEGILALAGNLAPAVAGPADAGVTVKGRSEAQESLKAATAVVRNPDGKVVGLLAVPPDAAKLKQVEEMKADFISKVSHELRTPLVAVKQSISLVLDRTAGAISQKQADLLSIARRNIERLTRLVNDVLDLSKAEAGAMRASLRETGLAEVVRDVVTSLGPWAENRRVSLAGEVPENFPKVFADPDRLVQILTNLAGNAIKFTPAGGRVIISAVPPPATGGGNRPSVKVLVRDTGPGIPKEDLPRVFDKFHQAGLKEPADVKGTGLGLTIAKHLVELHKGRIGVESVLGQGTTFHFTLLAATPELLSQGIEMPVSPRGGRVRGWFLRLAARLFGRSIPPDPPLTKGGRGDSGTRKTDGLLGGGP